MSTKGDPRALRVECEGYGNAHKRPTRATLCVIWTRRPHGLILEIKHRHLCGTHANMMHNGYDRDDTWEERPVNVCLDAAPKAEGTAP